MAPPRINPTIKAIRAKAEKLHKQNESVHKTRQELAALLHTGKKDGLTFKQLSDACGMSVAWVQSQLQGVGYKTKIRSPRGR